MDSTEFVSKVSQSVEPDLRGSEEEDKLVIRVKMNRMIARRLRHPTDPVSMVNYPVSKRDIKVSFSHMKEQLQLRQDMKEYEDDILEALKEIDFPRERHKETVEEIFKVVQEAVSPKIPIIAFGAYATYLLGTGHPQYIMMRPVTMRLTEKSDSCPICLNHLVAEEQDLNKLVWDLSRLPCRHLFHKDCIRPWLYKNHTCPTCRHKIPPEEGMWGPDRIFRTATRPTRKRPY